MPREEQTDVLVVGAGPVGMLSALLLSRSGVRVRIIDQEWRTASRTYACALHPTTLKLCETLGLTREILSSGRRVTSVAFYEGETRRAEVKLSELKSDFPFVLVVAQSAFEHLLEEKLKQEAKLTIDWNHRLARLQPDGASAVATIEKLGVSAKGYIIPEMDWSVEKTGTTRAAYVVGADGPSSFVAQSLGLEFERRGGSEFFAVYEFQSDWDAGDELRIVLDRDTTSVLWPLPGNRLRWSFQLLEEHLREFPAKERSAIVVGDPTLDKANREFVQKLVRERAPWFKGAIHEIGWSTDVEFEHRCAKRFGQGQGWLVGDAAHQTGPAGMQSMNRGLLEAEQLVTIVAGVVRSHGSSRDKLEEYNRTCVADWQRLLGFTADLKSRPEVAPWVKERSARILPCLPASGADLDALLGQLGLDWA